jgi:hypothetical protein
MSRIGASLSGLEQLFLKQLQAVDSAALNSAIKLATGKQVPRPSFDPSAFVLISSFENRLNVVESTQPQVDVAANIGAESQLALDEYRTQLTAIRSALLLDEEQSLTAEERAVQQSLVDASIEQIQGIVGREIGGRTYLDGSTNYTFSGKDSSQIGEIQAFALRETTFSGSVSSAATQSVASYTGTAGNIDSGDATFTLSGKRGATTVSVIDGETLAEVASRINQESHKTGITAEAAGDTLTFTTVDYGDNARLDLAVSSGTFTTAVSATGNTQLDGNRVSYTNNGAHVSFEFQSGFTGTFNPVTVSDTNVAKFSLTPEINNVSTFSLPSVQAERMGGVSGKLSDLLSGGSLSGLGANTSGAIRVIDEALADLTLIEGRVDAFADITVASSAKLLEDFKGELSDTLQTLNTVDEDRESLLLAKNQTLASTTISALSILQRQQFNTLGLVQLLAGI